MKNLKPKSHFKTVWINLFTFSVLVFSTTALMANNSCRDLFRFEVERYFQPLELPLFDNLIVNQTDIFRELNWEIYPGGIDTFVATHPEINGVYFYFKNKLDKDSQGTFEIDISYEDRDFKKMSSDLRFIFRETFQQSYTEFLSVLLTKDQNGFAHLKLRLSLNHQSHQFHLLEVIIQYLKIKNSHVILPVKLINRSEQVLATIWFNHKFGFQAQKSAQGLRVETTDVFVGP